ncbi:hypothetical protein CVT25_010909 [Psilocybe cyanescens]|uniref:Uncharacterized protein n=1 Tax=Psilocybe cyanescens TaxID=93625 RepID=A0A409WFQ4_PSICY|nr:hypothetical protein CVT25_010909 [Psilocybe cyanescens]
MASLGLEQATAPSATALAEKSPSPQPPSLPGSPRPGSSAAPSRSSSSPSLREMATRHRLSRYSPYSPAVSLTRRRGSLSSVSSSSDFESSPLSATFYIPSRPTLSRPRKYRNKLSANTYGSSSDLNADTPISTYVRRKTPGTSPTTPTFSRDSGYESSSPTPMPFSIPSLPVLLQHSASSESFPDTPSSDADVMDFRSSSPSTPLADITDGNDYYRFIRRRIGTRISTHPRPNTLKSHHSRRK